MFFDPLAEILVSEENSEIIALGISISPRKTTIFVASDENRNLSRMAEHLQALWIGLQEIRCDVLETGPGYSEVPTEPARKFRELVYQYSWDKQWSRYNEYIELLPELRWLLQEVLSDSSHGTKDPSKCDTDDEYGEYIPEDDVPLVMLLQEVLDLTESYNAEKSPTTLHKLISDIAILNRTLRTTEFEVITRLRVIYFRKKRKRLVFSIQSLYDMMCAFELSMEKIIISIPYNLRPGVILDKELSIVPISTEAVPLKYDVLEDPLVRRVVEEAWWKYEDFCERWKWDTESSEYMEMRSCDSSVHPHCECNLLAYLIKAMVEGDADTAPYDYIGLSEPLCVGCQLFFNAYNDVARGYGLAKFYTRGFQSMDVRPWTLPRDIPSNLRDVIECNLTKLSKEVLVRILYKVNRSEDNYFLDF